VAASATSAGNRILSSRDALPRKTIRPARQSRSSAGSLMSQLSSTRCTSFAVIAFGKLVSSQPALGGAGVPSGSAGSARQRAGGHDREAIPRDETPPQSVAKQYIR
jgi:hypothetical protein